jgi:acetyltransferase-like isoleucine patch superfamily enzyme
MLTALLMALLPSPLQVPMRRLLGARIAAGVRIGFGTILAARDVEIGEGARIGPFCVVRARTLRVGAFTQIKPLSLIKATLVSLGSYVHIAPTAVIAGDLSASCRFEVGDHSRIFPFCWLEPGEGITIGKHVGIGGHTLVFTHGAWSDYLLGGPVAYGPVVIEDRVWLPWRVFVLANVTIGHDAIIGAGAIVTKNVPPNALAAGMPAKVLSETAIRPLDAAQRRARTEEILREFGSRGWPAERSNPATFDDGVLTFESRIAIDRSDGLKPGDLLMVVDAPLDAGMRQELAAREINVLDHPTGRLLIAGERPYVDDFTAFLRRYGIRVSREYARPGSRTVRESP